MNVACHDVNVMPFGVALLWYDLVMSCNSMEGSCRYAMNDSCNATNVSCGNVMTMSCRHVMNMTCYESAVLSEPLGPFPLLNCNPALSPAPRVPIN